MTDKRRTQAATGSGGAPRIKAGGPPSLLDRVRAAPCAALALGVLAVAAYLCLVNLDYAALWHDEAPAALIGRNLLQRGDISGWDGCNLVGGTNGRTLNHELRDVLPPLTYVLNAAGMALFGVNETGARIMPGAARDRHARSAVSAAAAVPAGPSATDPLAPAVRGLVAATAAVLSSIALLRVPGIRAGRRVLPVRALVAQ